jgi:glycine/D-amino acid oxidase-like deaminating enzyme
MTTIRSIAKTSEAVLIIGGGASGVVLSCHLLRDLVTLLERRAEVGRGVAYFTADPNQAVRAKDPVRARRSWHLSAARGRARPPQTSGACSWQSIPA